MTKNKTTFYLDDDIEKKLVTWMAKYYELTGNKITKTAVIRMLLNALLDTDNPEQDIRDMQ